MVLGGALGVFSIFSYPPLDQLKSGLFALPLLGESWEEVLTSESGIYIVIY